MSISLTGRRPKGVLFDLDNTLYDREAAFDRWLIWFLDEVLKLEGLEERAALTAEVAAMDARGYGSKRAIFQRLRQRYPAPPGMPAPSVEIFYDQFFTQMRVEPETRALLAALRDADIPYGIVTNGSRIQARKITEMGFDKGTDCVFVSGLVGWDKPAGAIFEMAARKLDLPPSEILFVGDHPHNDIWGAREAGMRTAWLHRGQTWPAETCGAPPEIVLDRVEDLIPLFA
ncbi:haloacid dehalogenase [Capsulimonas corticalis]|uniref:Haloacid dehalogenase n=1 Tax=Capsulimonas corticalis TaxID=2219043 RepID=A0A402D4K4_9BACT|nr:HAD family hydrolase [Capsulimonas corticalis]BDI29156.1 haloacid dehalogenase [Capsulimonas corticalis]